MKQHSNLRQDGRRRRGFSLVEALATVAIIGVITFLAIPNIVRMRQDAERNMAVARAEAFNLGVAAYVQAVGPAFATSQWPGKDAQERYDLVRPYLAFAPSLLSDYVSSPYSLDTSTSISATGAVDKVGLFDDTIGESGDVVLY